MPDVRRCAGHLWTSAVSNRAVSQVLPALPTVSARSQRVERRVLPRSRCPLFNSQGSRGCRASRRPEAAGHSWPHPQPRTPAPPTQRRKDRRRGNEAHPSVLVPFPETHDVILYNPHTPQKWHPEHRANTGRAPKKPVPREDVSQCREIRVNMVWYCIHTERGRLLSRDSRGASGGEATTEKSQHVQAAAILNLSRLNRSGAGPPSSTASFVSGNAVRKVGEPWSLSNTVLPYTPMT